MQFCKWKNSEKPTQNHTEDICIKFSIRKLFELNFIAVHLDRNGKYVPIFFIH